GTRDSNSSMSGPLRICCRQTRAFCAVPATNHGGLEAKSNRAVNKRIALVALSDRVAQGDDAGALASTARNGRATAADHPTPQIATSSPLSRWNQLPRSLPEQIALVCRRPRGPGGKLLRFPVRLRRPLLHPPVG